MSQIEQDAGRDPITERPYCPSCLKNDNLMILMSYDYSQTKMMRVDAYKCPKCHRVLYS